LGCGFSGFDANDYGVIGIGAGAAEPVGQAGGLDRPKGVDGLACGPDNP